MSLEDVDGGTIDMSFDLPVPKRKRFTETTEHQANKRTSTVFPGVKYDDAPDFDRPNIHFTGSADELHYPPGMFRRDGEGNLRALVTDGKGGTKLTPPIGPGLFSGTKSVRNYGAAGDGETDDTQAFVDAIAEQCLVYVPAGTYLITQPIKLRDCTSMFGDDPRSCVLKLADGTEGDAITSFDASEERVFYEDTPQGTDDSDSYNHAFRYIGFDANGFGQTSWFSFGSGNVTFDSCLFRNTGVSAIEIVSDYARSTTLLNNEFLANGSFDAAMLTVGTGSGSSVVTPVIYVKDNRLRKTSADDVACDIVKNQAGDSDSTGRIIYLTHNAVENVSGSGVSRLFARSVSTVPPNERVTYWKNSVVGSNSLLNVEPETFSLDNPRPVNVRSFGARGDDQTDDTLAFDAAFAAVDAVFVPSGTYILGTPRQDESGDGKRAGIELRGKKTLICESANVVLKLAANLSSSTNSIGVVGLFNGRNTVVGNGATLDFNGNNGSSYNGGDMATIAVWNGDHDVIRDLICKNPGNNIAANVRLKDNEYTHVENVFSDRTNGQRAHHFQLNGTNDHNTLIGCTALGTGLQDDNEGDEDGYRFYQQGRYNVFVGCKAIDTRAGFQNWNNARANQFVGCQAIGCRTYGFASLANQDDCTWTNCQAWDCGRAGMYIRGDHNVVSGYYGVRNGKDASYDWISEPIKKGPDNTLAGENTSFDMVVTGADNTVDSAYFFDPPDTKPVKACILNLASGNRFSNCAQRGVYSPTYVTNTTGMGVVGVGGDQSVAFLTDYRPATDLNFYVTPGLMVATNSYLRGDLTVGGSASGVSGNDFTVSSGLTAQSGLVVNTGGDGGLAVDGDGLTADGPTVFTRRTKTTSLPGDVKVGTLEARKILLNADEPDFDKDNEDYFAVAKVQGLNLDNNAFRIRPKTGPPGINLVCEGDAGSVTLTGNYGGNVFDFNGAGISDVSQIRSGPGPNNSGNSLEIRGDPVSFNSSNVTIRPDGTTTINKVDRALNVEGASVFGDPDSALPNDRGNVTIGGDLRTEGQTTAVGDLTVEDKILVPNGGIALGSKAGTVLPDTGGIAAGGRISAPDIRANTINTENQTDLIDFNCFIQLDDTVSGTTGVFPCVASQPGTTNTSFPFGTFLAANTTSDTLPVNAVNAQCNPVIALSTAPNNRAGRIFLEEDANIDTSTGDYDSIPGFWYTRGVSGAQDFDGDGTTEFSILIQRSGLS